MSTPRNPTYLRRRAERLRAEEQQRELHRQYRLQQLALFEHWQRETLRQLLAAAQADLAHHGAPSVLTH